MPCRQTEQGTVAAMGKRWAGQPESVAVALVVVNRIALFLQLKAEHLYLLLHLSGPSLKTHLCPTPS